MARAYVTGEFTAVLLIITVSRVAARHGAERVRERDRCSRRGSAGRCGPASPARHPSMWARPCRSWSPGATTSPRTTWSSRMTVVRGVGVGAGRLDQQEQDAQGHADQEEDRRPAPRDGRDDPTTPASTPEPTGSRQRGSWIRLPALNCGSRARGHRRRSPRARQRVPAPSFRCLGVGVAIVPSGRRRGWSWIAAQRNSAVATAR